MTRSLAVLLALTALTLVVFALWPGLDLAVSHVFYDRGGFIGRDGLERFGRDFFRVTPFVVLAAFAALYALAPLWRRRSLRAERARLDRSSPSPWRSGPA